ncbi:MAG TPA: PEP/pyruvate-binding domain-containing protein [Rubrobacteraceae bacterium]|nr:PEP/pyruvate-binding domain-containing protein [Rubrobacteraceae bacterium]
MSTEPTGTHDRGEQGDAEKPHVDRLFDAPPRSEVVPLETLRRNDLERGGGKGANLGELISIGLPVPPGFCVTTAAYRRAVAETGLAEAIDEALRDIREEEDLASAEAASADIGTLFEDLPLPEDLAEAILAAYHSLGAPPVAVRSSATTEDLPDASFAGQQATSLNVRGGDELLGAVRRCWASLWLTRAIAYRKRQGFPHERAAVAVVVQRLVPAEVAGVLFTANPVTGARDELVVNAASGLGEVVVDGLTTPDSFILDRVTLTIRQQQTGRQEVETILTERGTTERPLGPDRATHPTLDEAQLARLGEVGLQIERHFGGPQDIEWAYAGGQLWVLQARPITNLPPVPLEDVRWEPPFPNSAWWRRQVVENLPEPLSPLFDELYVREGLELSIDAMMTFFRWTYFRLEDFADRPFFTTINGYAYSRANYKLSWSTIPIILRLTFDEFRILFREGPAYWREHALPSYLATIEQWKEVDPTEAPDERLLVGVRELALEDARYWFACALMIGAAKITDALLNRFLALATPSRSLTSGTFLRGFPSPTVDAETELEGLVEQIRTSDELRALVAATPAADLPEAMGGTPASQTWLATFWRYLDQYGHQVYNLDFVVPTQVDGPLPVLLSIKAMAQRPGRDPRTRQRAIVAERDTLVEETARSFDPLRRKLFRVLLGWAQRFGPYREQALFYMGAGWPTLRRLALELGRRLVESGSLLTAEDVFFLETSELREAIAAGKAEHPRPGFAHLARDRRELREARKRLHPPPVVPPDHKVRFGPLDMSAWETQQRNELTGMVLRGFAVSPGRVSAPASVILSPADFFRMEPDTILVCPTTTPAWTPLFAQARGLVTDVGGVLAHGSIVAREYAIPAVLGTGQASQRIRHGQSVTVDGDQGLVFLEESGQESRKDSFMAKKRWRDLTDLQKRAIVLSSAVQVALLAAALVDIYRRPQQGIRGSKRAWRAVSFVNLIGPVSYFLFGRKR